MRVEATIAVMVARAAAPGSYSRPHLSLQCGSDPLISNPAPEIVLASCSSRPPLLSCRWRIRCRVLVLTDLPQGCPPMGCGGGFIAVAFCARRGEGGGSLGYRRRVGSGAEAENIRADEKRRGGRSILWSEILTRAEVFHESNRHN